MCFKYHRFSGPPSFRLRKADQLSQFAQMPVTEAYVRRLSDSVQARVPVSVKVWFFQGRLRWLYWSQHLSWVMLSLIGGLVFISLVTNSDLYRAFHTHWSLLLELKQFASAFSLLQTINFYFFLIYLTISLKSQKLVTVARRRELQGWKQHLNKLNSIKQCYRTSVEELKQYYSTVG